MGRILLVEDDELISGSIRSIIRSVDPMQIVYSTGYSQIALKYARENAVDFFMLDIELLDYSGVELAQRIRSMERYKLTPMVFITNDYRMELEAYRNTQCYRFIRKPFTAQAVKDVVKTIIEYSLKESGEDARLTIRKKGYSVSVRQDDIVYFEVKGRKLMAVTRYEQVEISKCTIPEILEQVSQGFFQCHKSFVVNSRWIEAAEGTAGTIRLKGGFGEIPWGSRFHQQIEGVFR